MKELVLDIETTGLSPEKDKITVVGITGEDFEKVYRDLDVLYNDLLTTYSDYSLCGHNFTFDLRFLLNNGAPIELIDRWTNDTQIMAHVLSKKVPEDYLLEYEKQRFTLNKTLPQGVSHRQAKGLSLKVLAPYFLGIAPFWEDPSNHDNDEYVLLDTRYTYDLLQLFKKIMTPEEKEFYHNKMMPWAKMLLKTSERGLLIQPDILENVKVDTEKYADKLKADLRSIWKSAYEAYRQIKLDELKLGYKLKYEAAVNKAKKKDEDSIAKIKVRYKNLMTKALEKADFELNLDSPNQLKWLLKDYFKHSIEDMEGKETTGKAVLQRLANDGHADIELFLDYKKVRKIATSFIPTYKELAHENVIRPNFNLTGTRTGRLSASKPNLQQIPPTLYKLFKPRDGFTWLQYDYSSIEAKLIALYSEDAMLNTIVSKGGSLHDYNAKALFSLPCKPEEVPIKYPNERKIAKTIGFSVLYGAGPKRIRNAFASAGVIISEEDAKNKHKNLCEMFREAKQFHKDVTAMIEQGEPLYNLLGRPLHIPVEDAYMKAFNTLIQSSASDLLLEGVYRALASFKEANIEAYPLAFIHDFILIEVKENQANQANEILINALTNFNLTNKFGRVTLDVEGKIDKEWTK